MYAPGRRAIGICCPTSLSMVCGLRTGLRGTTSRPEMQVGLPLLLPSMATRSVGLRRSRLQHKATAGLRRTLWALRFAGAMAHRYWRSPGESGSRAVTAAWVQAGCAMGVKRNTRAERFYQQDGWTKCGAPPPYGTRRLRRSGTAAIFTLIRKRAPLPAETV